jgi:hypothetical protein
MGATPRKVGFGVPYLVGIVVFVAFGSVACLWFRNISVKEATYDEKRGEARLATRMELDKAAQAKLAAYAMVDPAKGIVQLPVARAMELAAADLGKKAIGPSSVAVENPYPYGMPRPGAAVATGTASGTTSGTTSGTAGGAQ